MARIELDPKQHIELTALRGERYKVYDLGKGQRRMVCRGKPIHYRTGLHWDDVVLDFEQQSEQFISARNKVSVGFSRGGKADKYLGLRYDCDRQFEVTLWDIVLDGKSQLPTTGNTFSTVTKDLDNQIVHTLSSGLRILHRLNEVSVVSLLEISDPIEDFEIVEELHLKGMACSNEQEGGTYLPDKQGGFNFIDPKTAELLFWIRLPWFSDAEGTCYTTLEHDLREDHGRLVYTKRPTKQGQDDLVLVRYPILVDTNIYYSTTADGNTSNEGGTGVSWATVRGAADGSHVADAASNYSAAMRAEYYNAKNDTFLITRSFFYFDTSNLPDAATVTGAVLKLYGFSQADSDVSAQKGSQADSLTTADYDAFTGSEYGHVSWATAQYNSITFNPTGRSDVNKTGTTKICCREYTHDYSDSAPVAAYPNGCYYSEEAGTTKDPRLEIDYTTALTINLDALTLAGTVPTLTIATGATAITLDALTLAGTLPGLTVLPGATAITLDALTLASIVPTLTVVPGASTVTLDALTLVGTVPTLTVAPGAVSVPCDALLLASSAESLTWTGANTVALDALVLSSSLPTLTLVMGAVSITCDVLLLVATVEALTVGIGVLLAKIDVTLGDTVVTSLLLSDSVVTSLLLSDSVVTSLALAAETRG